MLVLKYAGYFEGDRHCFTLTNESEDGRRKVINHKVPVARVPKMLACGVKLEECPLSELLYKIVEMGCY